MKQKDRKPGAALLAYLIEHGRTMAARGPSEAQVREGRTGETQSARLVVAPREEESLGWGVRDLDNSSQQNFGRAIAYFTSDDAAHYAIGKARRAYEARKKPAWG